ncbi:MAG: hypothetical protein HXY18_11185 [Bryobacteraceae bacterium]|nr:hypothetical protein [Bryobacteraceae bacterium]
MLLNRALPAAAVTLAPDDPLAITEVRTWPLREPLSRRRYTVLRLRAKAGIEGFGECGGLEAGDAESAERALAGQPATAVATIAARFTGRPALAAAVNMAALDLAARFAKVPLFQYLGGPTRFKVRAMTRLDDVAPNESMLRARAAGFRAFAVPLPARGAREQLEALRKAAGQEADFVLDAGGAGLPLRAAAALCREIETFHPYWFDEPCPASNLVGARRLANESVTPLGFGRDIADAASFEALLREEAVDVLRPSLALHGITGIRKLAAMAETRYVAVAPWHDGGPVGTAAALHLAASLPNFFIQQLPFPAAEEDRAMRAALSNSRLETPEGGFLALPQGHGLGVAPDVKALEQYREAAR